LTTVRNYIFSTFAATFHIWAPFLYPVPVPKLPARFWPAWSFAASSLWNTVQSLPVSCPVVSIFLCTSVSSAALRKLCNKCRHWAKWHPAYRLQTPTSSTPGQKL